MSLPNSNFDSVRVYANEYVNNTTVNRGNVRLIQNDIYLYSLINSVSGGTGNYILQSDFNAYSAEIDAKVDISYNNSQGLALTFSTVRSNSAGWESTESTVNSKKPLWDNTRSTVLANSASWDIGDDMIPLSGSDQIGGDLIPDTANTHDLGSAAYPWKDIYISSGSIWIGDKQISLDTSGRLSLGTAHLVQFVDPPSATTASGEPNQIAVSGQYLYVYNPSGSLNWGRISLDYGW